MSDSTQTLPAGLKTRKQTAEAYGVCERTVLRWEAQGLPVIILGKLRLHNPASVDAWIIALERRHAPPTRGRPRKAA